MRRFWLVWCLVLFSVRLGYAQQGPVPTDVAGIAKALVSRCENGQVLVKDTTASSGVRCATPGGAAVPGSGTELIYRVDGSTFGGITGSSVSGDDVTLPDLFTSAVVRAGSAPFASVGSIRLSNNTAVVSRSEEDAFDAVLVTLDDSDNIYVGSSNVHDYGAVEIDALTNGGTTYVFGASRSADQSGDGGTVYAFGGASGFTSGAEGSGGGVFLGGGLGGGSGQSGGSITLSPGIGLSSAASGVILLAGNTVIENGNAIRGDSTDAHTYKASVYDVNGAAYVDWLTVTNANTPSVVIAPPAGGTTISIQATTYKSSDGSTGATVTTCTAFKNGLCVSGT